MLYGLVLLVAGRLAYEAVRRPPFPAHVFTETRTELVWDGKPVAVEGVVHCERSVDYAPSGQLWFGVYGGMPPMYRCTPEWHAMDLPDGDVLLVGGFAVGDAGLRSSWGGGFIGYAPEKLDEHLEAVAKVPRAVIWLDDPVNPTRGEYYFSAVALDDPRSRLTSIKTEIVSVTRESAATRRLLFWKQPSNPTDVVPWLSGEYQPKYLSGVYGIVVPEGTWSEMPMISATVKEYKEPAAISMSKFPEREIVKLSRTAELTDESIHPFLRIEETRKGVWSNSRGDPATGYERSKRIQPLNEDSAGVLRFVDAFPK